MSQEHFQVLLMIVTAAAIALASCAALWMMDFRLKAKQMERLLGHAEQRLAREVAHRLELIEFAKTVPVPTGAMCCCGDPMEGHASPISCGHVPVEAYDNALNELLDRQAAERAKALS